MKKLPKSTRKYLKKHFKEIFYTYLESDLADNQKDRQNKLFAFFEIKKRI